MHRVFRRALTGLAAVALTLGLVVAVPATAEARTLSNPTVGTIEVEYTVALQDYDGFFRPAQSDECVKVQRKAGGVWRDNVTTGSGYNCSHTANLSWSIHDNTLALNTTAIRLVVIGTSQVLVACTSTDDCRQT
jgi:hypothetical protein